MFGLMETGAGMAADMFMVMVIGQGRGIVVHIYPEHGHTPVKVIIGEKGIGNNLAITEGLLRKQPSYFFNSSIKLCNESIVKGDDMLYDELLSTLTAVENPAVRSAYFEKSIVCSLSLVFITHIIV